MSSKKGRIKWNDSWLEKIDKQGQKCGTWAVKEDLDFARCNLCACRFKYSGSGGSQTIYIVLDAKGKIGLYIADEPI